MGRNREMSNLVITEQPEVKFCPICGLPLLLDGKCKKYHAPKKEKGKELHGKSKSPNRYYDYQ